MKKLSTFISFLCILNVLAILGLAAYLLGTGRLDKSKAQTITDILRTTATPTHFRTGVYDLMNPTATTAPASTQTSGVHDTELAGGDIPATAAERNQYVRKAIEAERLQHEVHAQDLQNEREMLEHMQALVASSAEKLEARKKKFEEQSATVGKQKDDVAFKRTLAVFDELKPQQIKDLLIQMKDEDIVAYLNAMETERTAKILSSFKTEKEKEVVSRVVGLMGGAPSPSGTGAASGNPAALSASAATPVKAGP